MDSYAPESQTEDIHPQKVFSDFKVSASSYSHKMSISTDTGQLRRLSLDGELGINTGQPSVKMKAECDDRQCSVGYPPPSPRLCDIASLHPDEVCHYMRALSW